MRTIKFRGKTIRSKEWVYSPTISQGTIKRKANKWFMEISENVWKGLQEGSLGQFTGLYDKDGKEIYEGDILGCHNPDIKHLIFYDEKEARFKAALNGDINNDFAGVGVCGLDDSRWNASKKVIGNIHDNPELLKGNNVWK